MSTDLLTYTPWLLRLALVVAAYYYMRSAITPRWVAQLVESEGVPSMRLALAAAVVAFCLCMDGAGRLTDPARSAWLGFAEILLGLGIVKVVGKAIAARPAVPDVDNSTTEIRAKTAPRDRYHR